MLYLIAKLYQNVSKITKKYIEIFIKLQYIEIVVRK